MYTIHDLLGNTALAQAGLTNLKAAFAVFASNQQQYPLVHETAWGGVVSTASYVTGNSGDDFGNTYYNDHHFQFVPLLHPHGTKLTDLATATSSTPPL